MARVDQMLNARAVGARFRAENTIPGSRLDLVQRIIRRPRHFFQVVLARKVLIRRLVKGNDELDGAIDE